MHMMICHRIVSICAVLALLLHCTTSTASLRPLALRRPLLHQRGSTDRKTTSTNNIALLHRGGAQKSVPQKKESKIVENLNKILPATRLYVLLIAACTAVHLTGLPAPEWFGLDISRHKWMQIWRPFTSMAYFGTPSMSMATSIYFLLNYGQSLEREMGSVTHLWFMLVQTVILSVLGLLFRFPFQSKAFVTSLIYNSSRRNSFEPIPFQFGLTIQSWQLCFCMMGIDCLSKQSIGAAWPHMLGILSGHTYLFFTEIWPSLGKNHRRLLSPPDWFIRSVSQLAYLNPDVATTAARQTKKGGHGRNAGIGDNILRRIQGKIFVKQSSGRRLGKDGMETIK